eukprot:g21569.t1
MPEVLRWPKKRPALWVIALVQDMAGGLRSSNQKLQGELDAERTARLEILHHLQQLKKSELAELKEVGQDSAISPVTNPP